MAVHGKPSPSEGVVVGRYDATTLSPSISDIQGPLLGSPSHLQAEWGEEVQYRSPTGAELNGSAGPRPPVLLP